MTFTYPSSQSHCPPVSFPFPPLPNPSHSHLFPQRPLLPRPNPPHQSLRNRWGSIIIVPFLGGGGGLSFRWSSLPPTPSHPFLLPFGASVLPLNEVRLGRLRPCRRGRDRRHRRRRRRRRRPRSARVNENGPLLPSPPLNSSSSTFGTMLSDRLLLLGPNARYSLYAQPMLLSYLHVVGR